MPVNALFSGSDAQWRDYEGPLRAAFIAEGLDVIFGRDLPQDTVDYIICSPVGPVKDFLVYSRLKAVFSLWAGVENLTSNQTLTVPLCRMVDPGLSEGMVEWVTGHVLRYHLGIDAHLAGQDGIWRNDVVPPLARQRKIGVLGLGALGLAVAQTLAALNFQVSGWSRSLKCADAINCYSGMDGLNEVLSESEILVLLLPHTKGTNNLLNAERLSKLPRRARIINPGRGALIDETDLLAALATGHIAHATLDVFRTEPLPPDHPFWAHPTVTVTPHIASETRALTASQTIAANMRRKTDGLPFLNVVDRNAGY